MVQLRDGRDLHELLLDDPPEIKEKIVQDRRLLSLVGRECTQEGLGFQKLRQAH